MYKEAGCEGANMRSQHGRMGAAAGELWGRDGERRCSWRP